MYFFFAYEKTGSNYKARLTTLESLATILKWFGKFSAFSLNFGVGERATIKFKRIIVFKSALFVQYLSFENIGRRLN